MSVDSEDVNNSKKKIEQALLQKAKEIAIARKKKINETEELNAAYQKFLISENNSSDEVKKNFEKRFLFWVKLNEIRRAKLEHNQKVIADHFFSKLNAEDSERLEKAYEAFVLNKMSEVESDEALMRDEIQANLSSSEINGLLHEAGSISKDFSEKMQALSQDKFMHDLLKNKTEAATSNISPAQQLEEVRVQVNQKYKSLLRDKRVLERELASLVDESAVSLGKNRLEKLQAEIKSEIDAGEKRKEDNQAKVLASQKRRDENLRQLKTAEDVMLKLNHSNETLIAEIDATKDKIEKKRQGLNGLLALGKSDKNYKKELRKRESHEDDISKLEKEIEADKKVLVEQRIEVDSSWKNIIDGGVDSQITKIIKILPLLKKATVLRTSADDKNERKLSDEQWGWILEALYQEQLAKSKIPVGADGEAQLKNLRNSLSENLKRLREEGPGAKFSDEKFLQEKIKGILRKWQDALGKYCEKYEQHGKLIQAYEAQSFKLFKLEDNISSKVGYVKKKVQEYEKRINVPEKSFPKNNAVILARRDLHRLESELTLIKARQEANLEGIKVKKTELQNLKMLTDSINGANSLEPDKNAQEKLRKLQAEENDFLEKAKNREPHINTLRERIKAVNIDIEKHKNITNEELEELIRTTNGNTAFSFLNAQLKKLEQDRIQLENQALEDVAISSSSPLWQLAKKRMLGKAEGIQKREAGVGNNLGLAELSILSPDDFNDVMELFGDVVSTDYNAANKEDFERILALEIILKKIPAGKKETLDLLAEQRSEKIISNDEDFYSSIKEEAEEDILSIVKKARSKVDELRLNKSISEVDGKVKLDALDRIERYILQKRKSREELEFQKLKEAQKLKELSQASDANEPVRNVSSSNDNVSKVSVDSAFMLEKAQREQELLLESMKESFDKLSKLLGNEEINVYKNQEDFFGLRNYWLRKMNHSLNEYVKEPGNEENYKKVLERIKNFSEACVKLLPDNDILGVKIVSEFSRNIEESFKAIFEAAQNGQIPRAESFGDDVIEEAQKIWKAAREKEKLNIKLKIAQEASEYVARRKDRNFDLDINALALSSLDVSKGIPEEVRDEYLRLQEMNQKLQKEVQSLSLQLIKDQSEVNRLREQLATEARNRIDSLQEAAHNAKSQLEALASELAHVKSKNLSEVQALNKKVEDAQMEAQKIADAAQKKIDSAQAEVQASHVSMDAKVSAVELALKDAETKHAAELEALKEDNKILGESLAVERQAVDEYFKQEVHNREIELNNTAELALIKNKNLSEVQALNKKVEDAQMEAQKIADAAQKKIDSAQNEVRAIHDSMNSKVTAAESALKQAERKYEADLEAWTKAFTNTLETNNRKRATDLKVLEEHVRSEMESDFQKQLNDQNRFNAQLLAEADRKLREEFAKEKEILVAEKKELAETIQKSFTGERTLFQEKMVALREQFEKERNEQMAHQRKLGEENTDIMQQLNAERKQREEQLQQFEKARAELVRNFENNKAAREEAYARELKNLNERQIGLQRQMEQYKNAERRKVAEHTPIPSLAQQNAAGPLQGKAKPNGKKPRIQMDLGMDQDISLVVGDKSENESQNQNQNKNEREEKRANDIPFAQPSPAQVVGGLFELVKKRAEKIGRKSKDKPENTSSPILEEKAWEEYKNKMKKTIAKKASINEMEEEDELDFLFKDREKAGGRYSRKQWEENRDIKRNLYQNWRIDNSEVEDPSNRFKIQHKDEDSDVFVTKAIVARDKNNKTIDLIAEDSHPGDVTILMMLEHAREVAKRTGKWEIKISDCEDSPEEARKMEMLALKMKLIPIFNEKSQAALDEYRQKNGIPPPEYPDAPRGPGSLHFTGR